MTATVSLCLHVISVLLLKVNKMCSKLYNVKLQHHKGHFCESGWYRCKFGWKKKLQDNIMLKIKIHAENARSESFLSSDEPWGLMILF